MRDLDRLTRTCERIARLQTRGRECEAALAQAAGRKELERVAHRLAQLAEALDRARRELLVLGEGGTPDALVHVAPLGHLGLQARDLLVKTYSNWAEQQRRPVEWLFHPLRAEDPALLSIGGPYAHGMLRLEAGIHRVRDAGRSGAARVRVIPWLDDVGEPAFREQRALKLVGVYGEKIRSRVECSGDLVVQNGRTLVKNRELAAQLLPSWRAAPPAGEEVVRRYDLDAPRLRDSLTGFSSGRPDALGAERFHALLCRRIDNAATEPAPEDPS